LSASDRKFCLNCSTGRLGLPSGGGSELRGGTLLVGDCPSRGETENTVLLSETRDGGPSIDFALEAADTDGDGSGVSLVRPDEKKVGVIVRERFSAGLAKGSD